MTLVHPAIRLSVLLVILLLPTAFFIEAAPPNVIIGRSFAGFTIAFAADPSSSLSSSFSSSSSSSLPSSITRRTFVGGSATSILSVSPGVGYSDSDSDSDSDENENGNKNKKNHGRQSMDGTKRKKDLFWNRETSSFGDYSDLDVIKEARILSLSDPKDASIDSLHKGTLPDGARLLAIGTCLDDFDLPTLRTEKPNVIFVSYAKAREPLVRLLRAFPTIQWVHSRSAGIDFVASEELSSIITASDDNNNNNKIVLTNAKGMFSSTLAEYVMMACSYFAKDVSRLLKQKRSKEWIKYDVLELRKSTLGVIGYGDIGRASAKLAKAYGMRVVALRRRRPSSSSSSISSLDPYCDEMYGTDGLHQLMSTSDYILVSTPLTNDTRDMIDAMALSKAKKGSVLINVGRGPVVDEDALINALKDGTLRGCALDVTSIEPLPKESELWDLDNVLLSPHNMDQTETFMYESTEFFVKENLPRYARGLDLFNPVDIAAGY